ncbi:hypothetical protein BC828DRAFT_346778 [Blastocladiella britannica]|nr:hypothetical protein BC828DRAFT_346778 [Blastocladiella britannica]
MDTANKKVIKEPTMCLVCSRDPIEYGGSSCGCPTLCKKCAMKQGTGGKCRTCHEMFGDVKRVVP